jgi:hypothetical protein
MVLVINVFIPHIHHGFCALLHLVIGGALLTT